MYVKGTGIYKCCVVKNSTPSYCKKWGQGAWDSYITAHAYKVDLFCIYLLSRD